MAVRIRIGNDIPIRWTVTRCGEPEDFTGRTLKLLMRTAYSETEVTDFAVDGNVISWTFRGSEQKTTGGYTFTLIENAGRDDMNTVDACDALKLVPCSCSESCEEEVEISTDITVPANGFSAYEIAVQHGFKGTEEEWLASLGQPAKDAAEKALEAAKTATEAAAATKELDKAVTAAEAERVKAESGRESAETERKSSETARASAEEKRNAAETARASAEEKRESAEQNRELAEAERQRTTATALAAAAQATSDAQKAANDVRTLEGAVTAAETKRTEAETARQSAETARAEAEKARAEAEEKRESAETERQRQFSESVQAAEEATQAASDAAALANQNVLAIQLDETTGRLSAITGQDGSAFESGEILETGDIALHFNYTEN